MTPLIRETIAWATTSGMDPTELQWFDMPDGRIVWVRPCKVGDASRGTVFHDYQVKEQK